jgi:hypothetical protein
MVQALVELHDFDQLAAATVNATSRRVSGDGYLVFSEEHEVWR